MMFNSISIISSNIIYAVSIIFIYSSFIFIEHATL